MFDLLFARAFFIVGGMILITALTARLNKLFETKTEMWATILSTIAFLFAIVFFEDIFPLNLILVAIFSALIGWQIGPTIELYRKRFMLKKYLKSRGIKIEKGKISPEQKAEFEKSIAGNSDDHGWGKIIYQTLLATALAIFATASAVFLTNINFSFMGSFLLIALIALIIMSISNAIFFRSRLFSLIKSYLGSLIFTLYLLYDFNRLEEMASDKSWGAAVDIAVNIYLDIINLFLYLLDILSN